MMDAKKKAYDLVNSYMRVKIYRDGESFYMTYYSARMCAIKAVDEVLLVLQSQVGSTHIAVYDFWEQVRKELN